VCSRLSPSSSGYKSQSQRSDATISPSPSPSPVSATITCSHTQVSSQDLVSPESNGGQTVIWAVTNLSSVPAGSIIINPQTNQPCTNADGSIYRYDPDNPPKFFAIENENGNIPVTNKQQQQQQQQQHAELSSEPSRVTGSSNFKNEGKKQRSSQSKINTGVTSVAQVTSTATSPSLPFTPPPPPPPPPLPSVSQNPSIPQPQMQQQPIPQQQQQQQQMQQQQPIPQQQNLVKSATIQTCSHTNQTAQQPYATYVPTSEPYNQGVYPPPMGQATVMMAPHPTQGQASSQGDVVFNQNQLYANYAMPVHQGPIPQSTVNVEA